MGGRGGAGGASGNSSKSSEEKMLLSKSGTERMPYALYKKEYSSAKTVQGTYDEKSKTVEVNVGKANQVIMGIMPDSYVKEMKAKNPGMSRYKIARDLHGQAEAIVINGVKLDASSPAWTKKVVSVVKTERNLLSKYGTLDAAQIKKEREFLKKMKRKK